MKGAMMAHLVNSMERDMGWTQCMKEWVLYGRCVLLTSSCCGDKGSIFLIWKLKE